MDTDKPILSLLKELQASTDVITLNYHPKREELYHHRELINEFVYRLYTFLGD